MSGLTRLSVSMHAIEHGDRVQGMTLPREMRGASETSVTQLGAQVRLPQNPVHGVGAHLSVATDRPAPPPPRQSLAGSWYCCIPPGTRTPSLRAPAFQNLRSGKETLRRRPHGTAQGCLRADSSRESEPAPAGRSHAICRSISGCASRAPPLHTSSGRSACLSRRIRSASMAARWFL